MSIRERYHAEFGISQHEAVDKPLIEMTGYIKWLEADYAELEKQRDELDIKVDKLEKHRDELLDGLEEIYNSGECIDNDAEDIIRIELICNELLEVKE